MLCLSLSDVCENSRKPCDNIVLCRPTFLFPHPVSSCIELCAGSPYRSNIQACAHFRCRSTGDVIPQVVLAQPLHASSNMDHCRLLYTVAGDQQDVYEYVQSLYLAPVLDMKYDERQRRKMRLSVASTVGDRAGPRQDRAAVISVSHFNVPYLPYRCHSF